MRKVFVAGGPNCRHPSFTWSWSAVSESIQFHLHPGDVALLVSQEEAKALRDELWAPIPHARGDWTPEHQARIDHIRGLKVMYEKHPRNSVHNPSRYVRDGLGRIEERDVDVREFCGLPQEEQSSVSFAG